jgi:Ca2+-binding RTX toxin-like protein
MFETAIDDHYGLADDFRVGGGGPYEQPSALAALLGGGFVATWYDNGFIHAQVFDQSGRALEAAEIVGSGSGPTVAALANGGFVVSWAGDHDYAQVFGADGSRIGSQIAVNSISSGGLPHIAALAGGGFVVTWDQASNYTYDDIRGQLFGADGSKIGGEFVVNDSKPGDKADSDVVALAGGGFVVGWFEWGAEVQDQWGNLSAGSRAQIFDAAGNKLGAAFSLNTFVVGYQQQPTLAALPSGGFVAAYADNGLNSLQQDTGHRGIWVQLFDGSGNKVGGEIHASSLGPYGQDMPTISVIPGTGFVVTWRDGNSTNESSAGNLRAQTFDFNGTKIGDEFAVSPQLNTGQMSPDVISLASGTLVFGWSSIHPNGDPDDFTLRMLFPVTHGTDGADTLIGGVNRDFIMGHSGDDSISGGAEDDNLSGDGGDDVMTGGDGNDILDGGAGNDTMSGGGGNDTLTGGDGNDTFRDTAGGLSGDTISDFTAADSIVVTDASLDGFTFSLSGNTLTFTGGSVLLTALPVGRIVAAAAAGGGVELSIFQQPAHDDFNGDGRSDVLWRSDDGTVTDWLALANGSGAFAGNSSLLTQVPTNWHIAGTGDFNGDRRADVLWRSDDGTVTDWIAQADGTFAGNSALVTQVATNWHIAGTGDFNGDGRDDVLWRSDDGTVTNWLAQADGTFAGNSSLLTQVAANWHIAGTGDFNGDGRDDVLWRSDDGTVTDWIAQPNGTFAGNSALVTQVPTNWHIAGTGDFNGDGRDDVIWRSDDGYVTAWLGQANGAFGGTSITSLASSWRVAQTGDFNGDGRDDVLWRSDDGHVTDWLGQADGSFSVSNSLNTAVSTTWHVYPQETFL